MMRIFRRYRGAGILFVADDRDSGRPMVLLGSRLRSGIWTIPGGGCEAWDEDSWGTAVREVTEEFGPIPEEAERIGFQRYPFGLLGFEWTTHVVRFGSVPEAGAFPWNHARDFHREFRSAQWFPLSDTPANTHVLLWPLLWRLRFGWLMTR